MNKDIDELLKLCERVIQSADNTGCSENLTVVSKEALDMLEDWITNRFEAE